MVYLRSFASKMSKCRILDPTRCWFEFTPPLFQFRIALFRSGRVKLAMWLPFRIFVGFRRPRHAVLGIELSGEIESIGAKVTRFRPGDNILAFTGRSFGAYGEYVCLREGGQYMPTDCVITSKPANITHAQAATAPTRGTLALHFLKKVNIQSGQRVLIYGASGGVGTFAIQLAKHFGTEVTGVCSTANLDLVRSLGADRVIDYAVEDGTTVGGPYDVFFDAVGSKRNSPLKSGAKLRSPGAADWYQSTPLQRCHPGTWMC